MHFRVGSKNPGTLLYVTTVKKSFQPLPNFCQKGLHLRCCTGLELNTATWSTKISKDIGGGHVPPTSIFFLLSFLHLIPNGLNGLNSTHLCGMWLSYKFFCSMFSEGKKPFDFIKHNIIQKLASKVKHIVKVMEVWSCSFFIIFFFFWSIKFF